MKKGDKIIIETTITAISDYNTVQIETGTFAKDWINMQIIKKVENIFIARDMLVWEYEEKHAQLKNVIDKYRDFFITKSDFDESFIMWKFAKELPNTNL